MRSVTRSLTLNEPVAATLTLTEIAEQLAWQALHDELKREVESGSGQIDRVQISLLAISVSNLVVRHSVQQELSVGPEDPHREGTEPGAARLAVDTSMDAVRAKYGRNAVGYLPAMSRAGVPDEFRELAEKEV
jgi:DNA polymerase IV